MAYIAARGRPDLKAEMLLARGDPWFLPHQALTVSGL